MATEMALASYPGFYLTSPPGEATAYGVFWPTLVARPDGRRGGRPPRRPSGLRRATADGPGRRPAERCPPAVAPDRRGRPTRPMRGSTRRVPLGTVDRGPFGRQGWQRQRRAVGRRRGRLCMAADRAHRRAFPSTPARGGHPPDRPLRAAQPLALNFVVHELLGEGVASSTRPDAQAKSLGEYLRSRLVDMPESLLAGTSRSPAHH